MSNAPFPIDAPMTAIAIAYRNARMIADQVLPRTPVGKQEFKYFRHNLAEGFTVPDTAVGRRGRVNEVEFSATEATDSTKDYGLEAPVPMNDIENAPANYDPNGHAVQGATNLLELDREVRVSSLVFNAATYPVGNKATLAGASQWSDPTSNPLAVIGDALDSVIMRPTIGVLGRRVSTLLRRHPRVVKGYNGTLGDEGMVPLQYLADQLELEEILVGESRVNIARPGQNPNLQRAWGNHAAFLYRDKLAGPQQGTTFGFTAQWGTRLAWKKFDENIGLKGGMRNRVGESLKELVTAPDLGYFFENAVTG